MQRHMCHMHVLGRGTPTNKMDTCTPSDSLRNSIRAVFYMCKTKRKYQASINLYIPLVLIVNTRQIFLADKSSIQIYKEPWPQQIWQDSMMFINYLASIERYHILGLSFIIAYIDIPKLITIISENIKNFELKQYYSSQHKVKKTCFT